VRARQQHDGHHLRQASFPPPLTDSCAGERWPHIDSVPCPSAPLTDSTTHSRAGKGGHPLIQCTDYTPTLTDSTHSRAGVGGGVSEWGRGTWD
jgi:hypothetical protein